MLDSPGRSERCRDAAGQRWLFNNDIVIPSLVPLSDGV